MKHPAFGLLIAFAMSITSISTLGSEMEVENINCIDTGGDGGEELKFDPHVDTTMIGNYCDKDVYIAFRAGHDWRWHTPSQLSFESKPTQTIEASPNFHWSLHYFFNSDHGLPEDFYRYQNSSDKNWSVAGIPPNSHVILPGTKSSGLVFKQCPPGKIPYQWEDC